MKDATANKRHWPVLIDISVYDLPGHVTLGHLALTLLLLLLLLLLVCMLCYILLTSNVVLGWMPTCESGHSRQLLYIIPYWETVIDLTFIGFKLLTFLTESLHSTDLATNSGIRTIGIINKATRRCQAVIFIVLSSDLFLLILAHFVSGQTAISIASVSHFGKSGNLNIEGSKMIELNQ